MLALRGEETSAALAHVGGMETSWRRAAVLLLCIGCGPTIDVIDHGGAGGGDGAAAGDEGDGSDDGMAGDSGDPPELRGGNFPLPAVPVCGELPAGVAAIPDLASAWVVTGPRNPVATELPVAASVPRLRFGSIGIEAGAPSVDDSMGEDCGQQGWMIAFDLPDPLEPGIYALAELTESYAEMYEGFPDGCGYGGTFAPDNTPSEVGELEIFAVTEACVMGELRGAELEPSLDFVADTNGGFVAQRASLGCVPMSTIECE